MIDLYYWTTPNGHKLTIYLEETGLPYAIHPVNISRGEQFKPEFLAISPNNRIPAIVDQKPADGGAPVSVFESGAILLYLAEKSGRLLSSAAASRAAALKWLFFGTSSIGPTAMQVHWLVRRRDKGEPHANLEIYRAELETLYGIADRRLAEAPYLAGDYSIADIAAYPWVYRHAMQGIAMARFPALAAWMARVAARPAVQRGMNIPPRSDGL
jgi:GSH-dependent disulfide-bond oxidoreductase